MTAMFCRISGTKITLSEWGEKGLKHLYDDLMAQSSSSVLSIYPNITISFDGFLSEYIMGEISISTKDALSKINTHDLHSAFCNFLAERFGVHS